MIRTDSEYREAVKRRDSEKMQIKEQRKKLQEQGLPPEVIEKGLQPYESFRLQLVEEIDAYERIKRGEIREIYNLNGIGQRLISIRIYLGLSLRELAQRLNVHETQVSRDEKNEYHGVTVERIDEILAALGVSMTSSFNVTMPRTDRER
jgi:hypothetical protein